MRQRPIRHWATLLLALTLTACGGGAGTTTPTDQTTTTPGTTTTSGTAVTTTTSATTTTTESVTTTTTTAELVLDEAAMTIASALREDWGDSSIGVLGPTVGFCQLGMGPVSDEATLFYFDSDDRDVGLILTVFLDAGQPSDMLDGFVARLQESNACSDSEQVHDRGTSTALRSASWVSMAGVEGLRIDISLTEEFSDAAAVDRVREFREFVFNFQNLLVSVEAQSLVPLTAEPFDPTSAFEAAVESVVAALSGLTG